MPDRPCAHLLYDSSDEQATSRSCLLCGQTWFHAPPVLPPGPLPACPRGRPRKESIA